MSRIGGPGDRTGDPAGNEVFLRGGEAPTVSAVVRQANAVGFAWKVN